MEKPGVALQRPVGSDKPFREHADLPTPASLDVKPRKEAPPKTEKAVKVRKTDAQPDRRAAASFEKERERRERQREKEEAAAEKAREKRQAAMDKAEAALAEASREHEDKASGIEKEISEAQELAEAEEERWQNEKRRLEENVRKASRS